MLLPVLRRLQILIVITLIVRGTFGQDRPPDLRARQQSELADRHFQNTPQTIDALDPETRQKFDELRKRLSAAEGAHKAAVERSLEQDPARERAMMLRSEASDSEQSLKSETRRTDEYVRQLPTGERKEARRALEAWATAKSAEFIEEWGRDSAMQPLMAGFAEAIIADVKRGTASASPMHEFISRKLQIDGEPTGKERPLQLLLAAYKAAGDRASREATESETHVQLPVWIKDHAAKQARQATLFVLADTYLQHSAPEDIEATSREISALHWRLSELWPRWRWAETPEEIRNPPAAVYIPPVGSSNKWLIGANVVVIVSVLAWLWFRRRRLTLSKPG